MISDIMKRLRLLVGRAEVLNSDDSAPVQRINIAGPMSGETHEVIHHQGYGLSVHAPAGSVPLVLEIGANRANLAAIHAQSPAHRPKDLAEGEVVIYSQHGQRIYLKEDGSVDITAPSGVNISGDTVISGNLSVSGQVALGQGGKAIARVGDRTSDGATIVEGSSEHTAS